MQSRITRAPIKQKQVDIQPLDNRMDNIYDVISMDMSNEINQFPSVESIGKDNVNDVLAGVVDGSLDMSVKGRTYTNAVVNGDFSDGTSGWVDYNNTSISSNNNVMQITGEGTSTLTRAFRILPQKFKSGDKIFIRAKARVTNADALNLRIFLRDGPDGTTYDVATTTIDNPEQYKWYNLNSVIDLLSDMSDNVYTMLDHSYLDSATSNGKTMEVQEVQVIDLTALGETDPDILAEKYPFIDSTQSTNPKRLKSVGKNLFDKTTVSFGKSISTSTGAEVSTSTHFVTDFIQIKQATYYKNIAGTVAYYDYNKVFISSQIGVKIITVPQGAVFVRADSPHVNIDIFQLEQGTTATEYSEYVESTSYIAPPQTLKRVPNGVSDEVVDGQLVQRVSDWHELQESDIESLTVSSTNIDFVQINSSILGATEGDGAIVEGKAIIPDFPREVIVAERDLVSSDGTFNYGSTILTLNFTKGTYPTLAEAQADLAGTKLIYQLATPVTTYLENPPQPLNSFENGTLMQENIIGDIGWYGDSLRVSDETYPIENIDFIKHVNQDTEAKIPLDISDAVIASDGLSFTHPDLIVGDLVDWDYYYDNSTTTNAELSYTAPLLGVKDLMRTIGAEGDVF